MIKSVWQWTQVWLRSFAQFTFMEPLFFSLKLSAFQAAHSHWDSKSKGCFPFKQYVQLAVSSKPSELLFFNEALQKPTLSYPSETVLFLKVRKITGWFCLYPNALSTPLHSSFQFVAFVYVTAVRFTTPPPRPWPSSDEARARTSVGGCLPRRCVCWGKYYPGFTLPFFCLKHKHLQFKSGWERSSEGWKKQWRGGKWGWRSQIQIKDEDSVMERDD